MAVPAERGESGRDRGAEGRRPCWVGFRVTRAAPGSAFYSRAGVGRPGGSRRQEGGKASCRISKGSQGKKVSPEGSAERLTARADTLPVRSAPNLFRSSPVKVRKLRPFGPHFLASRTD